jgi:Flp pilus assembly pilin Flp
MSFTRASRLFIIHLIASKCFGSGVKPMIPILKRLLTEEHAQDMVEYSLMLVLIGAVILIYLTGLGFSIGNILGEIGNRLSAVSNAVS